MNKAQTNKTDRITYIRQHGTPEDLQLVEQGKLSIVELYERLKARRDKSATPEEIEAFFEAYPRYLEAILWRHQQGWELSRILTYINMYQPQVTMNYISHVIYKEREETKEKRS